MPGRPRRLQEAQHESTDARLAHKQRARVRRCSLLSPQCLSKHALLQDREAAASHGAVVGAARSTSELGVCGARKTKELRCAPTYRNSGRSEQWTAG
jgi:hypothetical protein